MGVIMKKMSRFSLLLSLGILFVSVSGVKAEFGTISGTFQSAGSVARYAFLTAKNIGKAGVHAAMIPANLAAMPFVYYGKAFKKFPKLTSAGTVALLISLAVVWYTSPAEIMNNFIIKAINEKAIQLTPDVMTKTLQALKNYPEYAAWLKNQMCSFVGDQCGLVAQKVITECPEFSCMPCDPCQVCPPVEVCQEVTFSNWMSNFWNS